MWTLRRWQAEALPLIIDALKRRERAVVSAIMGAGKSVLIAELIAQAKPGARAVVVATPTQALVRQLAATLARRLGEERVGVFYADEKQPDRDVVVVCYPSLGALREALGRPVALLVMDEVHKSEGDRVKAEVQALRATSAVGFTATPYRSLPSESLELWDSIVYRYTLADALQDGVLVPMRRVVWDGVGSSDVDEVMAGMVEAADGPGIVSALSIADADAYASTLSDRGIAAASIHSRLTVEQRAACIQRLKTGDLDCLVHVSLLAEGVDLPWLAWIGLRRPVKARVRFIQELGRVLRCHPGKTEGVVLDPHDLLGLHGLTHTEAIGKALERIASAQAGEGGEGGPPVMTPAVAIGAVLEALHAVRLGLLDAGLVKPSAIPANGWRSKPPSEKQLAAVKRASRLTRHIPDEFRGVARTLIKRPHTMTAGEVSDLLDILFAGVRWAHAQDDWRKPYMRQWPAGWVELPEGLNVEAARVALKGVRRDALV